jgi:2,6-dihydroxypyridine 3-monooxygenase
VKVFVVGGSLGGLTAALLLADAGCEVDVWERSPAPLFGVGAGIVSHAATIRYFRERTVIDVSQVAVGTRYFRYVDAAGNLLLEEPCPYEFTSWSTLHGNLLALVPTHRYHPGHNLVGIDARPDGVTARFENGHAEDCDLLVCADGILSTARSLLAPDVRPTYAGYVGWRGLVEQEELSPEARAVLADSITYGILDGSHILSYPIPNLGNGGGGEFPLNFVWYRNVPEPELAELMVDRHGRRRPISLHPGDVQERFVTGLRDAARNELPPSLAEIVTLAEQPFVQAVVDVAVERMVYGRVCLIGDAAFAARPHAAAGTAKAAENGWTLAEAIGSQGDLDEALAAWEPGQLALGQALVERSRRMGELYQVTSTAQPGDPELHFGLYGPDR